MPVCSRFFRDRQRIASSGIFSNSHRISKSANSLVLDFPFYSNNSLRELPLPDVVSVLTDCLLHFSFLAMAETEYFSTLLN